MTTQFDNVRRDALRELADIGSGDAIGQVAGGSEETLWEPSSVRVAA